MATHSSILAWRIPQTEEPGRLQSTGSQRVRYDKATSAHAHTGPEVANKGALQVFNTSSSRQQTKKSPAMMHYLLPRQSRQNLFSNHDFLHCLLLTSCYRGTCTDHPGQKHITKGPQHPSKEDHYSHSYKHISQPEVDF